MANSDELEVISLLYPKGYERTSFKESSKDVETSIKDIGIDEILSVMNTTGKFNIKFKNIISQMTDNYEVIKYRLDILEDLLRNPKICNAFEELLPTMEELLEFDTQDIYSDDPVQHISKLGELELYIECVKKLKSCLTDDKFETKSEGLNTLKAILEEIVQSNTFISLVDELTHIREGFRQISSITIGVNLDAQLKPVEATLLSVNDEVYKSSNIIDRLLGLDFAKDKYHGLSPLEVMLKGSGREIELQRVSMQNAINSSLNSIFKSAVRSFTPAIRKYTRENGRLFSGLVPEIMFFLGAVKLIRTMEEAGLKMCKPEVKPKEERAFYVDGIYNIKLSLLLHSKNPERKLEEYIVCNEVRFGDEGRIFVLTGPNQGGKTTYIQAIGLAQMLFQLGLYVPGYYAAISPVDIILTHFPVEEKETVFKGRLGEECIRLNEIFSKVTRYSLVLLNESLTSTSPSEGAYIAKEILLGLKLAECRAVFATHFHELAMNLEKTNSEVPGDSKIESLVSGVVENSKGGANTSNDFSKRSYKITISAPSGNSYAKDIANQYGVSIEKIKDKLESRNKH